MRLSLANLAIAALGLAACGAAPAKPLVISALSKAAPMKLSCPAIGAGGKLAAKYSASGDNISPPMSWQPVKVAKDYAVIVEDPDSHGATPFVHWLIWNIPASRRSLPPGLADAQRLGDPKGAIQGANGRGRPGWTGPSPPAGDPPHHYHFEVFALRAPLAIPADSPVASVAAALKGDVLAASQCVGIFQTPAA
ncbi:MAG: YbhB/YbcL family Raf kinase inhibitor-like protein [Caulobacteraceae bacterium]